MKTPITLLKNEFSPEAIAPGEHLFDELRARKVKQKELAKMTGISNTALNEIIKGKRKISLPVAMKLEKALGISAETWLNLQNLYDRHKSFIKTKELLHNMKVPSHRHDSLLKASLV